MIHDDVMKMRRHGAALSVLAAAIVLALAAAAPAAAQSISGASASTSGSDGNSGDGDGSRRSSVGVQINDGTTLRTRFAWNLSADVGVFSTRDSNGTARHNVSFTVTTPGAYFLTVATQRVGDMNRINDASGCDGAANIEAVSGSHSGGTLTSGSLNLSDPGSIGNGGDDTSVPFNQSATARIDNTSDGVPKSHSLSFTWNGSTRSNSCEAAVRLGEGTSVSGCSACGYPGSPSRSDTGDGHFVTVTLNGLCGNGVINSAQGEDCDIAISNSPCCDANCQFASSSTACRAAAGVCDNTENCTGSAATCPSNSFRSSTTVCRPTSGVCDSAENCTGSTAACPGDGFQSSSTICRGMAGVCDEVERCTGTIPVCPSDGFASNATVCRGVAGVCDVAENCTGSSATCPSNGFKSSTSVCRAAGGVCDATENCTGSSFNCPLDTKRTAVCRSASDVCDAVESCDGLGDECPEDVPRPASVVCRAAAGVCDVAEQCDGANYACPADGKSTALCRAVADVCDTDETCDGSGNDCPADQFQPSTVECRAVAGECDVAESCTGTGAACPVDGFKPSTEVCRADAGDCDIEETCPGDGVECPGETFEPDGTTCSDDNECTVDDVCGEGECSGNSMQCADSVLQENCGEECDDGNFDAGDGCSPTCFVEPGLGCTTGPLNDCRRPFVPGKSSLQMVKRTPETDRLKWKWSKGVRTTVQEFGNPLDSTNYQVCVYDQTGLKFAITNPAGGTCAGKPCWKPTGIRGFSYRDPELTPDGGQKLGLKEGALGRAQITFGARGASLAMPDLATLVQPITVQIQNTDGICWEAVYSGPPIIQSGVKFKDRAD